MGRHLVGLSVAELRERQRQQKLASYEERRGARLRNDRYIRQNKTRDGIVQCFHQYGIDMCYDCLFLRVKFSMYVRTYV